MVRRLCSAALRLLLRVFFRRIEIAGAERIPATGPVIFALNHPNGLVDPLFLLCFAPRPVSFLAKAPLFRMPLIGFFVRAFGSIAVYRKQDPGTDVSRNLETFENARGLLSRGGVLALFPEGASHDEPKLLGFKTGAARIALGVAAEEGLHIVPASLYYTWKTRFRSSALLSFGKPLEVAAVPLDERGEPPPRATRELTHRIEAALSEITLHAESREALDLVRRAERIFSIEPEGSETPLAEQLDLRRRFVAGAALLRERDPARYAAIRARLTRFEAERKEAGLPLEHLTAEGLDVAGFRGRRRDPAGPGSGARDRRSRAGVRLRGPARPGIPGRPDRARPRPYLCPVAELLGQATRGRAPRDPRRFPGRRGAGSPPRAAADPLDSLSH